MDSAGVDVRPDGVAGASGDRQRPRTSSGASGGGSAAGRPRTLPRLTSLRALAALAVFVFHLGLRSVWAAPANASRIGYTGVAFFYILSGFVLAWGVTPTGTARTFYRRRVARIYPSHAVMLLVAVLLPLADEARTSLAALTNALLVQAWWPRDSVAYGMNGVSWSLSCEAFFYALFPVLFVVLTRLGRRARWGVPTAMLAVVAAVVLAAPDNHTVTSLAFHLPAARLGEFLLGVAAAVEMRDGWQPRLRPWHGVVAVLAAGLACVRAPYPLPNVIMAPAFLLLILAATCADAEGAPGALRHRWLVRAGELSFAFYLVHELVMINMAPVLHVPGAVAAVVILVMSGAGAVLLHHAVERPMQRILRDRRRPLSSAATPGDGVAIAGVVARSA